MAELNVQPKKKTSYLPWILLLLGAIVLIWFLTRNKDDNNRNIVSNSDTAITTATPATTLATGSAQETGNSDWNGIDFNTPPMDYEELTNREINVRGTTNYGIYSLEENILFDAGKSAIRPDAEARLKQVVASIKKRYNSGEVRVYGYTDAQGSAAVNKELAQQRADAVKAWLQNNGMDAAKVSVNAIGEAKPVASNNTERGRQQNRRVEIVARSSNTTNN